MKRSIITIPVMLMAVAFFAYCTNPTNTVKEDIKPINTNDSLIKRGGYLVSIVGCNDCHSPKKMGAHGPEVIPELMLSGYPSNRPVAKTDKACLQNGSAILNADFTSATGPWGTSFSGNLTPDSTGLGSWTEEQFKKAITQGKFKGLDGGRPLLPPMPWYNYKNMTDEDLKAIFLYLKTLKPVKNIVPSPVAPM